MYSSFSQMKSYCTLSIRLNRLKKGTGTTEYISFIFFLKSHFNRFFLSLLSVLSLRFLLKHETGLGFSLQLETPAWWWLTAWWLIGGLGLPISAWVCRSRPRLADLFLLSSGMGYIITSFSFPLFSSKSCEFGFVCDVFVRGLVVYGGLVGVELWMILNGISLISS